MFCLIKGPVKSGNFTRKLRSLGLAIALCFAGAGLTAAVQPGAAKADSFYIGTGGVGFAFGTGGYRGGVFYGGYRGGFARKMQAAQWIVDAGFPLTLNAVVHRQNLHQLPRAIEMAVEMKARRIGFVS